MRQQEKEADKTDKILDGKNDELESIADCLATLLSTKQTQSGNDLEVIKLSYQPGNLDPLIRLDRLSPANCLKEIISIAQTSLEREISNPTLEINPFSN